jgi:hypothetical protein
MRSRPVPGGRGGAAAFAGDNAISAGFFDYAKDPFVRMPDTCWPDYVVD